MGTHIFLYLKIVLNVEVSKCLQHMEYICVMVMARVDVALSKGT